MPKFAGIVTSLNEVDLVVLEENAGSFALQSSLALKTQIGDRAKAYHILYEQLADLLKESEAECVFVSEAASLPDATEGARSHADELRGVVQAAAASVCEVRLVNDAHAGQIPEGRSLGDILGDDAFWKHLGLARLKKEMRRAALTVVSQSV